jgi:hypothetical protein
VVVIGDLNTHSHVSVNDCQLNMNGDVFFTAQQDDEKEKKKKLAVQFFFLPSLSMTDIVNMIGLFNIRFMK